VRWATAVDLMSDYNQGLSVAEAVLRTACGLADEGLYWVEEPTSADDFEGHAEIRRKPAADPDGRELVGAARDGAAWRWAHPTSACPMR
jgi:hypothetical protein